MVVGAIIGGIVLLLIFWFIGLYNSMVKLKLGTENAWSDIDVILKKRYNLIPNLVETVKGYAGHEKGTLEAVIKARQQAVNITSDNIQNKIQAENFLSQALKSLFAVTENYPQLKADAHFKELMDQLQALETEIERARRYYNAIVRDFNTKVMVFPNSIVANMGGFQRLPFYEIEDATMRENVKVDFGTTPKE